jgi:hypothetical protein
VRNHVCWCLDQWTILLPIPVSILWFCLLVPLIPHLCVLHGIRQRQLRRPLIAPRSWFGQFWSNWGYMVTLYLIVITRICHRIGAHLLACAFWKPCLHSHSCLCQPFGICYSSFNNNRKLLFGTLSKPHWPLYHLKAMDIRISLICLLCS